MHWTKEHFKPCQGNRLQLFKKKKKKAARSLANLCLVKLEPGQPVLGKVKQVVMTVVLRDKRQLLKQRLKSPPARDRQTPTQGNTAHTCLTARTFHGGSRDTLLLSHFP